MLNTRTTSDYLTESKKIKSDCFSIAFFRPDSATTYPVKVNGIPVEQGKTLEINQLPGHFDTTEYEVLFDTSGGGGSSELYVIKIVPVFAK